MNHNVNYGLKLITMCQYWLIHCNKCPYFYKMFFPGGWDSKASAYSAGSPGSILGLGRSLGEGNGNPLQYSCLENPMDRGSWRATVHGVAKSQTWLSDFHMSCISTVISGAGKCPHLFNLYWSRCLPITCNQKNGGIVKRSLPTRVDGDCFKRLLPLKTNIPVYLYAAAFFFIF